MKQCKICEGKYGEIHAKGMCKPCYDEDYYNKNKIKIKAKQKEYKLRRGDIT